MADCLRPVQSCRTHAGRRYKIISKNVETRTYTVYKFDELPEEGKKEAIERYHDINVDDEMWHNNDRIYEVKKNILELGYKGESEIDMVDVLFSGFGSQGDGACFEGTVDIPRWLKAHKLDKKYAALMKEANGGNVTAVLKHSGHYYHSRMTDTIWNWENCSENEAREMNEVDDLILKERAALGDELYKALENEYGDLTSDEAVIDTFRANESDFTIDGKID